MKKNISEVIMNPIRLQIVQYLMVHEMGTTKEIKEQLSNVPPASLYRHIKTLVDAGLIEVVEEKKIRGTFEKTYKLIPNPMGEEASKDVNGIIQRGLLMLMSSFQKYFSKEGLDPVNDPQKDMLLMSTTALMLSDEEMMQMLQQIGEIFKKVMSNGPEAGRKLRQLTLVSSPTE